MRSLQLFRAIPHPNSPALCALASLGLLAASSAQAAYLISETNARGTMSVSGNSLGAFTLAPGYFAFQNKVTFSDPVAYAEALELPPSEFPTTYYLAPVPANTLRFADGLIDRAAPAGTIITGSYPVGGESPPEDFIVFEFNGPDPDPANPSTKTYLLPGDVAINSYKFETLPGATGVRFNISATSHLPEDELDYTYMLSGTITFGTDGADDLYNSSYVLRSSDNQVLITVRATGFGASAIPEPSAYVFYLGVVSLAAGILARRPRRFRNACSS